jgi:hypothetical protein
MVSKVVGAADRYFTRVRVIRRVWKPAALEFLGLYKW